MKIKLNKVRASFLNIYTPRGFNGQDPKFSASFLMDPKTDEGKENIKICNDAIKSLIASDFKGKKLASDKYFLKDGDEKDVQGWEGMMVINASNKNRPVVVDNKRQPVVDGETGAPYSGCYVNVIIDVWPMNNEFGKRIPARLDAIQFAGHGDPFGAGSVNVENEFDEIELDDDDELDI